MSKRAGRMREDVFYIAVAGVLAYLVARAATSRNTGGLMYAAPAAPAARPSPYVNWLGSVGDPSKIYDPVVTLDGQRYYRGADGALLTGEQVEWAQ